MTRIRIRDWILLAALAAILVQCAIAARPYDQTFAVITQNHGRIDSGERFGLAVGMPVEEARVELTRRGWRERPRDAVEAIERRSPCFGRVAREGEQVLLFKDRSWRHGTICLLTKAEEISSIYWIFSPFVI